MTDEQLAPPQPFERHAQIVLGITFVVLLIAVLVLLAGDVTPLFVLVAAGPAGGLLGATIWGLVVRRWWAAAAAFALLWALVIQGLIDVVVALQHGGITIPLGAILAGGVLLIDRPSLTERGRPVAVLVGVLYVADVVLGLALGRTMSGL